MIRVGTRASRLARTQTGFVADALAATGQGVEIVAIRSEGDNTHVPLNSFAKPGAFVTTLRDALLAGRIDVVVHSFKDLPSAPLPGLTLAAIPRRAGVHDVLVTRDGRGLADLPAGARIGTSSPRRAAALRRTRPDLVIVPIRGNVDTRLAAVGGGNVDAVVLAEAGLLRLGLLRPDMVMLDPAVMLPAPAQGALAIECRTNDPLLSLVATLNDPVTGLCVGAERAVLAGVDAACTTAIGALAHVADGRLWLEAELTAHKGVEYAHCVGSIDATQAASAQADKLGRQVAQQLLAGAR